METVYLIATLDPEQGYQRYQPIGSEYNTKEEAIKALNDIKPGKTAEEYSVFEIKRYDTYWTDELITSKVI